MSHLSTKKYISSKENEIPPQIESLLTGYISYPAKSQKVHGSGVTDRLDPVDLAKQDNTRAFSALP